MRLEAPDAPEYDWDTVLVKMLSLTKQGIYLAGQRMTIRCLPVSPL
jgi:hypothetical protein